MLRISEIWRLRQSVDKDWRSPMADDVGELWGLPRGSALWWRSSSTHVFIVPSSPIWDGAVYLRFAPADTRQAEKIAISAQLMQAWANLGLGVVKPIPSLSGRLTETIETANGTTVAMLVPAAAGEDVSVDDLTISQAEAWGQALAELHQASLDSRSLQDSFQDGAFHVEAFRAPGQDAGERPASAARTAVRNGIQRVAEAIAQLDPATHSRGVCHGDFELDNIRFSPNGPVFFDSDEAHFGWFAGDVALAVRDLMGVTLGSRQRPRLLDAFLAGYRRRRLFTEEEERSLPLHSLAASGRLLIQLDRVLDAGWNPDEPEWIRDLHASIAEHRLWHHQRILAGEP